MLIADAFDLRLFANPGLPFQIRHFWAVDDVSIECHLRGTDAIGALFVMGVYPMLADNTCSFLAADFGEGE
jgi:hypothetical protein